MAPKDFRKIRMPSSQQMRAAMQKHLPALHLREAPPAARPVEPADKTVTTAPAADLPQPITTNRPATEQVTSNGLPPKISLGAARAEAAAHAEAVHEADAVTAQLNALQAKQQLATTKSAAPVQAAVADQPPADTPTAGAPDPVEADDRMISTTTSQNETIEIFALETAEPDQTELSETSEPISPKTDAADESAEKDSQDEPDEPNQKPIASRQPVTAMPAPAVTAPRQPALPTPFPTVVTAARPTAAAEREPLIAPTVTVADALASQAARAWRGTPVLDKHYGRNLWLFVWILLLIGASQISLFTAPLVGLYVNAAVFAHLVYMALRQEKIRPLLVSVAIIPLAMLFSLSLPEMTPFLRTTNLMIVILLLGLVYQYLFTLDYPTEGTRLKLTRHGYLFAIPLMLMLGQFLGLFGFGLLHNQYDFQDGMLPLVALAAVVFAVAEEILFRGLIQQRAMTVFHPLTAAILSAVLYTAVSFGHHGGILTPIFAAVLGGVLATVYYRKQNIVLTIGINAGAKLTYIGLVAIFILRG